MNVFEERIDEYNRQQLSSANEGQKNLETTPHLSDVDIAKYDRYYKRFMDFATKNIDRVGSVESFGEEMNLDNIVTKTIYTEYGPIIATSADSTEFLTCEGIYLLEIDGVKQLRYFDSNLLTEDFNCYIVKGNDGKLVAIPTRNKTNYEEINNQLSSYFNEQLSQVTDKETESE